jgi:excisionase family DNA binding protein
VQGLKDGIPNWVSVGYAAHALSISRQRVHQLIRDGSLDAVMSGGLWLVRWSSVEMRARQARLNWNGGSE